MTYEDVLTALADPTRRGIFAALKGGERAVSDISADQTVSRPAVSQHLKALEAAGLVTVRAEGTRRLYAARPEGLEALRRWLDQEWAQLLDAYAADVKKKLGH